MSNFHIRDLAQACAPRICAAVERVVIETVRAELPRTIEAVLREQFPGETLRLYVPKLSVASRRDRDIAIRAQFTGRNHGELSRRFGLSIKQIARIVIV